MAALSIFGQREADNWVYGVSFYNPAQDETEGTTVFNFNSEPPILTYYPELTLDYYVTNAAISDNLGNFLFATNGMRTTDYQDEVLIDTMGFIEDGNYWDLFEGIPNEPLGYSFPQGTLILPIPDHPSEYVVLYHYATPEDETDIFTMQYLLEARIQYGENIENKVLYKDKIVANFKHFGIGKIATVRHANGRDWWIAVPTRDSNLYYFLLASSSGIQVHHTQELSPIIYDGPGTARFSEDGTKYVRCDNVSYDSGRIFTIMDFDRCSGEFNNIRQSSVTPYLIPSGATISPNNRFVYVVENNDTLWQYDLENENLEKSRILIGVYDGFIDLTNPNFPRSTRFGLLFSGTNGKGYLLPTAVGGRYFGVINRPDEKGTACNFVQHQIVSPSYNQRSVPNYGNFRLGPIDGSPCDTLGIDNLPVAKWRYELEDPGLSSLEYRFTDRSYFNPQTWHWDFDDGSTSDLQHPIHSFDKSGTYHVCLTVSNENASDQSCQEIEVVFSSIEEYKALDQLRIFPNPVTDFLEVRLPAQTPLRLELMTLDSKTLFDPVLTCPCRISLASLPAGMYLLHVYEGKKLVRVEKLVKY